MDSLEDIYPLSPTQQAILFHSLSTPDAVELYVVQMRTQLTGEVDLPALERALQWVVDRHPALRTSFLWEDLDDPVQVVQGHVEIPVSRHDLAGLDPAQAEERIAAYLEEDRRQGFCLAEPPLARVALFTLPSNSTARHLFLLTFHTLWLADGWSKGIVFREVVDTYEALCRGEQPQLPPPRAYSEYIRWLQDRDLSEPGAYWRGYLAGFTAPTPLQGSAQTEKRISDSLSRHYGDEGTEWEGELTSSIEAFARKHRLTMSTLFQAAWAFLLSRYSMKRDLVFGAAVSGRPPDLPGAESIVGLLINTVPVRVQVEPDSLVLPCLEELQRQQNRMRPYESIALSQIRKWSEVPAHLPLFESVLFYQNWPHLHRESILAHLHSEPLIRTMYPLTLCVIPEPTTIRCHLAYARRRFDSELARTILSDLKETVRRMIQRPEQSISQLLEGIAELRAQSPEPRAQSAASTRRIVGPRTPTEEALVGLFKGLLEVEQISVCDNFFELGADSLLAARLFSGIRALTGRDLPLATLFQAPTVEQLAAVLSEEGWSPLWSSLVPIRPEGNRPPFFCVHAHGGNVVGFHDLARHLGPDQPFYALQAQGLDGMQPLPSSIEAMAAHYVDEIRTAQPEGPYFLGGHCFGGLVVFEMARQLETGGERVGLLALIDIEAHSADRSVPLLDALRWHLENLSPLDMKGRLRYLSKRATGKVRRSAEEAYRRLKGETLPAPLRELARHHGELAKAYAPRTYRGRVTLLRLGGDRARFAADFGWGQWAAGGVEVHEVPGDSFTLLAEPYVRGLARCLRDALVRAQEGPAVPCEVAAAR